MTAGRKIKTKSQDWCTPLKYAKPIEEFFVKIDLDPCSNKESIVNAEVKLYDNGLVHNWDKYNTIYVNPPYGKACNSSIYDWLKKCYETKAEVIALIPVATNTKHWKNFVFKANVICFLSDTRLKFLINGTTNNKGASMACCLVYWGGRTENFISKFKKYGTCCIPINSA